MSQIYVFAFSTQMDFFVFKIGGNNSSWQFSLCAVHTDVLFQMVLKDVAKEHSQEFHQQTIFKHFYDNALNQVAGLCQMLQIQA